MSFIGNIIREKRRYIIIYIFCVILTFPIVFMGSKESIDKYNSFKACERITLLCLDKNIGKEEKDEYACSIRAQCKPEEKPIVYNIYLLIAFFIIPVVFTYYQISIHKNHA